MTHFGIICPASTGHLNPMTTLGYELKQRGHRVTVIAIADAQPTVLAAGLEFRAIGESDFPPGATKELFTQLGNMSGLKALQYTLALLSNFTKICLQDSPEVIKTTGIEALLVDQASPAGGTVAEYLDIPFVSVCSALMLNREINVPPFNMLWDYDVSWRGVIRNKIGYALLTLIGKPLRKIINDYRRDWNLPPHHNYNDNHSKLAQLSQQPAEFEFPRKELPSCFHFTGPYYYATSVSPEEIPFPYEKLTGQPLIYASMGTLQNKLIGVFQMIAEACVDLDAQLVITLGWGTNPESLPEFPGNPIVVGYAPQLELLKKATLTITHAGMNTTLHSLSQGVSLVSIPITNEQPGIAARVAWTGVGEVLSLKKLNVDILNKTIKQVLNDDSYRKNALKIQEAISRAGGVTRAADIIEQVLKIDH